MTNTIDKLKRGYTVADNGCWLWHGTVKKHGYCEISYAGKVHRAHRLFYELFKGKIPSGLVIDHLCKTKNCVNPAHLEAVTQAENIKRGTAWEWNRGKTHCSNGHEYSESNTIFYSNRRDCRICAKNRKKKYRQRLTDTSAV